MISEACRRVGGSPYQSDHAQAPDCDLTEFAVTAKGSKPWMLWLLFSGAIVFSFLVHEIGHCVVAWSYGYGAIPTPAKEYVLSPMPEALHCQVALGGILGSVAALLATLFWSHRHPTAISSALLAGAVTAPGFYTLRFALAGRGHDATEFQDAQAALGLASSGHAVDWLFVGLFVAATGFWFLRTRTRLSPRLAVRLIAGALAALLVVILLQTVNNAIFDPLFQRAALGGLLQHLHEPRKLKPSLYSYQTCAKRLPRTASINRSMSISPLTTESTTRTCPGAHTGDDDRGVENEDIAGFIPCQMTICDLGQRLRLSSAKLGATSRKTESVMSKEIQFDQYSVAGKRVKCPHCGNETFGPGSALLNTRGLTFFNLDWANRAAHLLICQTCGKVEWFLQPPEKLS